MKKNMTWILLTAMLLSLCACGKQPAPAASSAPQTPARTEQQTTQEPETTRQTPESPATKEFTDSLGRTVTVPADIQKVAISGPLAQIYLFALCPDKLAGIASAWDEGAKVYLNTEYYNLPELGQLYGGKGEMNLETLLASGAQVVIDVGEPKKSAQEDLDALQAQTGIPFVHVTATTQTAGAAYRMLGELLDMTQEAEKIAAYCDEVYKRTTELAASVEKAGVLYCLGDKGLNVIATGSYHAEIIDLLTNNLAVVDNPSSKGTGNEVDMEQILLWNPDIILFAPDSIYDTVADDAVWQQVAAIQNGTYYKVPFGPYNWMGFPPSVQRYLGMTWLSQLLYPEQTQLNLYEEAARYFELFYHCSLTQEQFDAMTAGSLGN